MENYKKITIKANSKNFERICNYLYLFNINSFLEEENKLIFYLPENFSFKNLLSKIKKKFPNLSTKVENFQNIDWDKKWKTTIKPVYIKNRLVIYPSWKKSKIKNIKNLIKIVIDPKMSFGTGHNETTQLSLEMLLDYLSPQDRFLLDFGTGTGILAIAAAKLGVSEIIAIDNDIEAIKNAIENINKNRTSKRITLLPSSIDSIKFSDFDIVIANITTDVIKKYFKYIYSKLKSNGKLILSGILKEEKSNFSAFLNRNGIIIKEIREKNYWTSFYCLKKQIRNDK